MICALRDLLQLDTPVTSTFSMCIVDGAAGSTGDGMMIHADLTPRERYPHYIHVAMPIPKFTPARWAGPTDTLSILLGLHLPSL